MSSCPAHWQCPSLPACLPFRRVPDARIRLAIRPISLPLTLQVGIVSHGYFIASSYCFVRYPSVFTDVAAARKWIDAGIQVGSWWVRCWAHDGLMAHLAGRGCEHTYGAAVMGRHVRCCLQQAVAFQTHKA